MSFRDLILKGIINDQTEIIVNYQADFLSREDPLETGLRQSRGLWYQDQILQHCMKQIDSYQVYPGQNRVVINLY